MSSAALDPLAPEPPPTMDELPYDDGEPMESEKHRNGMYLLIDAAVRYFADRPDVYVSGNMGLYYSVLQARNADFKAPDFFVVLDAIPGRERKSWVVWEEDGRVPNVVIELVSASTEREDRGRKMRVYASLNVHEYFLYDPRDDRLEGYRLDAAQRYRPIPARPDGDLDCESLGLRLGVVHCAWMGHSHPWLRWRAPDGSLLLTGREAEHEEFARAEQERERAERERERAERERERAEQESLRAEQERERAEQESLRAEQERERADLQRLHAGQESVRANLAEAKAQQLAARLRALGVDPEG